MSEINYAEKYSNEIDERFTLASVTDKAVNKNFDFNGVNKVFVYSVNTAEVNDYSMSGTDRYGTPTELGNRVQELELTQDKAFTFTIDRRNNDDTMMTMHAGRCLQRQIDEVIIPMMDKYRLEKLVENATQIHASNLYGMSTCVAGHSIYFTILKMGAKMTNKKVPTNGRIIFMTPEAYMDLKCSREYRGSADTAASIAQTGNASMVDGMEIQVVPSDYLPENTLFLITHPCAMCSPVKLAEYNVHENPPGISGWLVEGRTYYDAFVLDNKKDAIALVIDDGKNDTTLSDLTIGNLTLDPEFSADVTEYTTTTSNATNTITATATDNFATIEIQVNGSDLKNGSSATWNSGENKVRISVRNGGDIDQYNVTVTKE